MLAHRLFSHLSRNGSEPRQELRPRLASRCCRAWQICPVSGEPSRLRDRSRPEVASLHGRDRHVDRLLCEAAEAGIELEIIAGDLLARGDVDDGVAFVENAE